MELQAKRLFLSGLLIFGFICSGLSKPATNDEIMHDEPDYPHDYDDEDNVSPQRSTLPDLKSTLPPFFEIKDYTEHVKPGENAVLKCPVENAGNSVIFWYNGTLLIVNQFVPVDTDGRIKIDKNHTLTIMNVTKHDSGDYKCEILGKKPMSLHVKLHVSLKHDHEQQDHEQQDQTMSNEIQTQNQHGGAEAHSSSDKIRNSFALISTTITTTTLLLSINFVNKFLRI